jgi:hypothetical protein
MNVGLIFIQKAVMSCTKTTTVYGNGIIRRQYTYNVMPGRVRVTILAVESNK